jgi:hypothetical protein
MIKADLIKFTDKYYWTYDTQETSEIKKNNKKNVDNLLEAKDRFENIKDNIMKTSNIANSEIFSNKGILLS